MLIFTILAKKSLAADLRCSKNDFVLRNSRVILCNSFNLGICNSLIHLELIGPGDQHWTTKNYKRPHVVFVSVFGRETFLRIRLENFLTKFCLSEMLKILPKIS